MSDAKRPRPRYPSDDAPRDRSARPPIAITLDAELLAAIDAARGDESRSAWIARACAEMIARAK